MTKKKQYPLWSKILCGFLGMLAMTVFIKSEPEYEYPDKARYLCMHKIEQMYQVTDWGFKNSDQIVKDNGDNTYSVNLGLAIEPITYGGEVLVRGKCEVTDLGNGKSHVTKPVLKVM